VMEGSCNGVGAAENACLVKQSGKTEEDGATRDVVKRRLGERNIDHPKVDRRVQPARLDNEVSATILEKLTKGEVEDLDVEVLQNLKVFAEEDNQLSVKDVLQMPLPCLECTAEGELRRAELIIPNFGKAEIQSFSCSVCSFSYRKVRSVAPENSGLGDLPASLGRKIVLHVESGEDLDREVLRGDSCIMKVPRLDIVCCIRDGAMSTVEGCLRQVVMNLENMRMLDDELVVQDDITSSLRDRVEMLTSAVRQCSDSFEFILKDEDDASNIQSMGTDDKKLRFETYVLEEDSDSDSDSDSSSSDEEEEEGEGNNCGLTHLFVGAKIQAQYCEEWITSCEVVRIDAEETFWVRDINAPNAGAWQVKRYQVRGCDNPLCPCQATSISTDLPSGAIGCDLNMLQYLNDFADHMQVQEGKIPTHVKQKMNSSSVQGKMTLV